MPVRAVRVDRRMTREDKSTFIDVALRAREEAVYAHNLLATSLLQILQSNERLADSRKSPLQVGNEQLVAKE